MLEVPGLPTDGLMVRGRPIVLASGDYLLPVYHETGADTESVGPDSTSRFLRYSVQQKRWFDAGAIRSSKGNIQPAVAEIAPDHLVAYCRRGGNYEPTTSGWAVRSESRDGGRSWSRGEDSRFPNPNSALDLLRLRNGHLLLVYNDSMNDRKPLAVSLSTDGDRSWPIKRTLGNQLDTYAYPTAVQTADGRIHVVFTSRGRTEIWHAVFDEDWVAGK
jgi:predicted neuraminidase